MVFSSMLRRQYQSLESQNDPARADGSAQPLVPTDQGIETATFHVMTPYPGTALFQRMEAEGRLLHRDWDLYDTRHTVFRPARLTPEQLENGYWHAYKRLYAWGNILKGAMTKETAGALRHLAYAGGWKKSEWMWHALIRMRSRGASM